VIRRLAPRGRDDEGAYAILYAALVVVLLAFGAIVVDFATVRQDRRLNRSAADSAALGGVSLLDPSTNQGAQPYAACLKAWDYLATTLRITAPVGRCGAFQTLTQAQIAAKCLQTNPAEIADERTVGNRTFVISWPIPDTGSAFLTPDLAPGSAGAQPANGTTDGNPLYHGCDRLGVAVFEDEKFGLAGAFGATGTTTQTHSVALVRPQEGPAEDIAALNVLNPTQCQSLVTTGNGKVTVGPALDDAGNPTGPGIIAVEAAGTSNCNGQSKVIDPTTGQGSLICASATAIGSNQCDGLGLILSHALDPGGDASKAYNGAAVPSNLRPMPTAENGIHGWVPVTRHYGCDNLPGNCSAPTPNYIEELVDAYGGSSSPGTNHYSSSQPPYNSIDPYPGGFDSPAELCPGGAGITTVVVLSAGNHYANCDLNIQGGGAVIHPGGTLVVKGAISIAAGGCLTMNTAVTSCPTSVVGTSGSGIAVTTPVPPTADAILFVQGNSCPNSYCFRNQGNLVIPQTFVYMGGNSPLLQNSTQLTLWTAPGAGARDGADHTRLEVMCGATTSGEADEDCMDSRFGKLAFWSEYAAPSSQGHQFAGQGNLNVVGIFFTPRAYFNLTGGGGYTGSAAQFWSDKLNVNGGANLGLSPFESFSLPNFGPDIALIR
jgi:hypothetical protein